MTDTNWIEWHGGEQPVPDGTLVEAIFFGDVDNSYPESNLAEDWDWKHLGNSGDIIRYRVIREDDNPAQESAVCDCPIAVQISAENAALRANSLKPLSVMGRFELDLYAEQHEQLCKNLGVERISIVEAVEKVAALCAEVAALTKQLGECSGALESYRKQIDMLEVQAVNSIAPGWVSIPAVEWDSIMGPLATAEKERKHG